MKYIKQFESSQLLVSVSVALFPDVRNKNKNTGKWSTFFGASGNKKIEQEYFNIIWQKYFGKNDPCENKQLGPCRPEFLSYPMELANFLIYFNYLSTNVIEFEESDKKIYWKYSNQYKEPEVRKKYPESDISMKIEFNSTEEAFDWLNILRFALNNKKEEIETYILSKKYNL